MFEFEGNNEVVGPTRRRLLIGVASLLSSTFLLPVTQQAVAASAKGLRADPRYAFVNHLADLVIPRTDTGGAADAQAAGFVLLAFDQSMAGLHPEMLQHLKKELERRVDGDFLKAPHNLQLSTLTAVDHEAYSADPSAGSVGEAWRHFKAAVLAAYYSSELGASKELVYEPVPGKRGNFELTPDYRARSNEGFGEGL